MFALLLSVCFAQALSLQPEPEIAIHNTILTQVNGTTISLLDVTKKMDLLFHQQYPQLRDSEAARYQFYESSWRHVLQDLVDQELILADALAKEVQVNDAEVREELDQKFGPNLLKTLDTLALSYEDAWKMIKNELIARRMTGHFIYAKALQNVTPQDVRQAYQRYIKEHPAFREWTYQILAIHTDSVHEATAVAEFLHATPQAPDLALSRLKEEFPTLALQVSKEYVARDSDLSTSYVEILSALTPHQYSRPISNIAQRSKPLFRLFYLHDMTLHTPSSFEELASQIHNELLQQSAEEESLRYLTQLRKRYHCDLFESHTSFPEDFHPFQLQ